MDTRIDLSEKNAIVTGGSRGIGSEICLLFAKAGARVTFGYNQNEAGARDLVDEIKGLGGESLAVPGDVRQRETFEQLFLNSREAFGPVDIAVGNAGIWKRAPIDAMTEEEWQETLGVNLTSIYHLCHFAAREMKARHRGTIVLVGSTAGQRGEAFHSHYAATKGAIHAMTKSLAAELGPQGIRVNCAAPGWVETDMSAAALDDPQLRGQIQSLIPLGRVASPEQVANTVLFLASELASHVHGEILNVNGGSVLCG